MDNFATDSPAGPQWIAPGVGLLRADNPSEMTLQGTNSYLVFDPALQRPAADTEVIVIDPGPDLEEHLAVLAGFNVRLVIATHRHADHTGGLDRFVELTGAPVRAWLPEFCRAGEPLRDGEVVGVAGAALTVVHTPGHTSDSVCLVRADGASGLFTGDTVLGEGTTILEHPDGTLRDYLASLERLLQLQDLPLHPAHGAQHPGSHRLLEAYLLHREERLAQVREALAHLGRQPGQVSPAELLPRVYPDLDPRLVGAATHSLQAQLHYLASTV